MVLTAVDYDAAHWTIRTDSGYIAPAQVSSDYVEPTGWRGGTNKAIKASVAMGAWVIRQLDTPTMYEMQGKVAIKSLDGYFEVEIYQASPGEIQMGARIQANMNSGGSVSVFNDAGSVVDTMVIGSMGAAWWTIDWTTREEVGPIYMLDCNIRDAAGTIIDSSTDNIIKSGTPASKAWGLGGFNGTSTLIDGIRWKINTP